MIDQQINLYLSEFRLKKDQLTTVLMLQILAGVIGIMVPMTWLFTIRLREQRACCSTAQQFLPQLTKTSTRFM